MKRLVLIRHPEIAGAEQLKYFGNTDVALSEQGQKQAECLADFLSRRRVKAVYCSNLQRARYPAQLVAERFNLSINIVSGLRELNFGRWEGKTFQEMLEDDEQLCRAWFNMEPGYRLPGGESLGEFYQRIMQEYNNILADGVHTQDGELIVILTHGGVIKFILADLLGLQWGKVNCIKQDFGALNLIEYQNGHGVLRLMNDTCYLERTACHV
jgi:broad specificity phosphatase PhoE